MNEKVFFEKAKAIVCAYANDHLDVSDEQRIGLDDVYIVWSCKILQNWKGYSGFENLEV